MSAGTKRREEIFFNLWKDGAGLFLPGRPPRGKVGNLARKLFFFLPRRMRPFAALPLVVPVNGLLYAMATVLDLTNRRDVFFFALLAEKPCPEPIGSIA